jgi:hypothetical protein
MVGHSSSHCAQKHIMFVRIQQLFWIVGHPNTHWKTFNVHGTYGFGNTLWSTPLVLAPTFSPQHPFFKALWSHDVAGGWVGDWDIVGLVALYF